MAGTSLRLPYTPPKGFPVDVDKAEVKELAKYLDTLVRQIELAINNLNGGAGGGDFSNAQGSAIFDGGGVVLVAGTSVSTVIPYNANILGWTLLGNASGSAVVDVQVDTLANYPPTGGDSIVGANPPTLTAATNSTGDTTGWTATSFVAGDIVRFSLSSVSTLTQLTLVLTLEKT